MVKKKTVKKVKAKKTTKKKTTKKLVVKKNYLVMVLDESGSMYSIKKEAIDAFNEQVQTAKKNKGNLEVYVDLVKFSSDVSVVFENKNAETVEELTNEKYIPNGNTAMYDGIGKAVELLKARPDINDSDVTVLMLVISDGQENASKLWTAQKVAEELKSLQNTGRWTVTFSGANLDLDKLSKQLYIPQGNMVTFSATSAGLTQNTALRSMSSQKLYASYNSGEARSVERFFDRNNQNNNVVPLVKDPKDKSSS